VLIELGAVLAPSNEAFAKYLNSTNYARNDTDKLEAVLSYHVLRGSFARGLFKNSPQFIPTLLSNPRYANVTGGQRVEVTSSGDGVAFYSAIRAVSNLVTPVRFKLVPGAWIWVYD
jgi:uncharacterized surface protein with fasciclin (FAS1) repeats